MGGIEKGSTVKHLTLLEEDFITDNISEGYWPESAVDINIIEDFEEDGRIPKNTPIIIIEE